MKSEGSFEPLDQRVLSPLLQVPNKVRNLLWRACRDAMPTKANLVRRKIIKEPLCDRCHEAHETPLHALGLCKERSEERRVGKEC